MYGKSKKIGFLLGTISVVAMGISLVVPTKQPPVS